MLDKTPLTNLDKQLRVTVGTIVGELILPTSSPELGTVASMTVSTVAGVCRADPEEDSVVPMAPEIRLTMYVSVVANEVTGPVHMMTNQHSCCTVTV